MKRLVAKNVIFTLRLSVLLITCILKASGQISEHTCGAENVHNPAIACGEVKDIDGNSYKTVVIDDLVWFAENLKVTRFQNGDIIPDVSEAGAWSGLTGPGMCSYKNDTSYDCPRGKLYNFFVADLGTLSAGENKAPLFTIFPNPADDYIQINSDQRINGEAYVISDLTGRVVLAGRILSDNTIISVTDLPPGMYFLTLPETNGGVSKIIKQ